MEEATSLNQLQSDASRTNKFIPVPIRRSDPVLERCHIPTANSAYLRLSDSITSLTSYNSSISSSIAESHVVDSYSTNPPPQSENSLADPLARLLIPGVPTNVHPMHQPTSVCSINNNSPSLQSAPRIVSKSPQEATKISSTTLSKLLTNTNTSPSHEFLNYICSTTAVDTKPIQPTDEPTFTVTSVKRSDREFVKAVHQKKESPKPQQDPYIQSVAMLTQLVTQNTHLVKTALDAISVAAIKPHQVNAVNYAEPPATSSSLERKVPETPQIPQQQIQLQQQSQQQQRPSETYRTSTKAFQRKPTRIPKPAASPGANTTHQYPSSMPLFTPNDNHSTIKAGTDDNLIGVPIRAQEYMPKGSCFDFLNALIKEEHYEEVSRTHKEDSAAPAFDPFLNDLVNAASQLDDLVDSICSDVSYTGKTRTARGTS